MEVILNKLADEIAEAVAVRKRMYELNRQEDLYKWMGIESGLRIALKIIEDESRG